MPKPVSYIAAAMLLIGAAPMPYGYYGLLRMIATVAFIWAAYTSFEQDRPLLPWILAALALLFNPLIPIHLTKSIWAIVDVASAVFLVAVSWFLGKDPKERPRLRSRDLLSSSILASRPNDSLSATQTFELARLRREKEQESELKRAKLKYRATQLALFAFIKIPFFFAIVMIAVEAFTKHFLAGLLMSFFVFFSFIAFFIIPDDGMPPLSEMKAQIRRLEQERDGRNDEQL